MGLIQDILDLKRRKQVEQQADESFRAKQVRDQMDTSVKDIMNQMSLGQVAQPVQDGKVNEPTVNYSTPSMVQGLPDIQSTIPGGPTPLSPDRQTVTYNSPANGKMQYALNSPERNAQLADTAAARERSNKVLDEQAVEQAKQDALNFGHSRARQIQLEQEGGGTPAGSAFLDLGIPEFQEDGKRTMMTRAEMLGAQEALGKINEQKATTRKTQADAQKLEQENSFLQNLKPQDIHSAVDQVIPASDSRSMALNRRTHAAVNTALMMGDKKGALAAIKDAGDQLGRTETAIASAQGTAPVKIEIARDTAAAKDAASGMTDDDFQREGQKYALTGVMPPLGMQAGGRQKILHYANEFARQNNLSPKDLATIQASFAGDKDSLKKFQAQRDQIVSFEGTAGKNLDQFIDLASKIPDTGSPWLNIPVRQLTKNMVGDANMAAVDAARQIANNEIAKVTSGGGLSGVLSDSARHEVQGFNPQNATLKQTLQVAKVLRADMANRHQSMDAMLGEIKNRMGTTGNSNGGPAATHRFNPATGKIEEIKQ